MREHMNEIKQGSGERMKGKENLGRRKKHPSQTNGRWKRKQKCENRKELLPHLALPPLIWALPLWFWPHPWVVINSFFLHLTAPSLLTLTLVAVAHHNHLVSFYLVLATPLSGLAPPTTPGPSLSTFSQCIVALST